MSEIYTEKNGRLVSDRGVGELSILSMEGEGYSAHFAQFSSDTHRFAYGNEKRTYNFWNEQYKSLEQAKEMAEDFYNRVSFIASDNQIEMGF